MKYNKKTPARRLKKHDITNLVTAYFHHRPGEVIDVRILFRSLHLNTHPSKLLCMDVLDDLVEEGFLTERSPLRYCCNEDQQRTNDEEMEAILNDFGLPTGYPADIAAFAEDIPTEITAKDIKEREDFRDRTTFTIDPRDAKDFDDALSFQRLEKGGYEIGVHIADVSHYVPEGSPIDKEALRRSTSVYLVDRVVPMLPERLCNEVCSLRPNEDKLCYSVIFHLNDKAEIKHWHLAHTVIRSNRRFTYEEVQELLEARHEASEEDYTAPGDHKPLPGAEFDHDPSLLVPVEDFADALITLNRLAKVLRTRRFAAGAVDFDRSEVRFDLDKNGHPTGVYFKNSKDANKLIEEFMLLANRTVAESIGKGHGKPKTLPYRVHDIPDPDKLLELSRFVGQFGCKLKTKGSKSTVSASLNTMLHSCRGSRQQSLIELVTLRAMQKAKYSTINIGHYGLAFAFYTHFTSPIRRYPDLMVHRLLTRYAEGEKSANKDYYEGLCEHCSEREQAATQAERMSVKYKQVEFMSSQVGVSFKAMITGVTDYGFYVEINENKCEGLVPMRSLTDDYYEYDEAHFRLVGRRYHRHYALGDTVTVRLNRANLIRKQLDFLVEE